VTQDVGPEFKPQYHTHTHKRISRKNHAGFRVDCNSAVLFLEADRERRMPYENSDKLD
jgi:hypothetical protein